MTLDYDLKYCCRLLGLITGVWYRLGLKKEEMFDIYVHAVTTLGFKKTH